MTVPRLLERFRERAAHSAVRPSAVFALTFAPCSASRRTTSRWPFSDANTSAV